MLFLFGEVGKQNGLCKRKCFSLQDFEINGLIKSKVVCVVRIDCSRIFNFFG